LTRHEIFWLAAAAIGCALFAFSINPIRAEEPSARWVVALGIVAGICVVLGAFALCPTRRSGFAPACPQGGPLIIFNAEKINGHLKK